MSDQPYLNTAAVKKMALKYARQNRASKFSRVSSSFLDRINSQVALMVASELKADEVPSYINRTAVKKLAEKIMENEGIDMKFNGVIMERINRRIIEIIQSEVHRNPSGKTLT